MAEFDASHPGKVTFELVSPERILLSEAVEMVVIPGTEGDFGVLPGHSPLISSIRPGTIRVYAGTNVTESIFVPSGFAEVTPERCTVLADSAISVASLNRDAVTAELAEATAALAAAGTAVDAYEGKQLSQAVLVATAKLEAIDTK
jgi:F-type H+-transporting ATPase subunit epsilon